MYFELRSRLVKVRWRLLRVIFARSYSAGRVVAASLHLTDLILSWLTFSFSFSLFLFGASPPSSTCFSLAPRFSSFSLSLSSFRFGIRARSCDATTLPTSSSRDHVPLALSFSLCLLSCTNFRPTTIRPGKSFYPDSLIRQHLASLRRSYFLCVHNI